MHWVLQTNIYKEIGLSKLVEALCKERITFSMHKVEPFTGAIVPEIITEENIFVYGTHQLCKTAKKNEWFPGIFEISQYSYQDLIDNWGRTVLNYGMQVQRFDSVIPPSDPFFIKPDTEQKAFTGYVTSVEDFNRWQLSMYGNDIVSSDDNRQIKPGLMVVVSKPVNIFREFRFWIVDGQIVTYSQYRANDKVEHIRYECKEAIDFVERRISQWQPSRAFVLDVAETDTEANEWKVIEINTFNCSGLYDADVSEIVRHVEMMRF